MNFETMTKEEALEYCYMHRKQYIHDAVEDGERLFDCLIYILEEGSIQPKDLPNYGMDY